MENKSRKARSIISFLLAVTLILQSFSGYIGEVKAAEETPIELSSDGGTVYLLTSSTYVGNEGLQLGANNYSLSGTTSTRSVVVGNYTYDDTSYTNSSDISVVLNGVNINDSQSLTVNSIASGSDYHKLNLSVTGDSTISNLIIQANAQVALSLAADLTIGSITMAEGSELTVDAGDKAFTITNGITGSGNVSLKGNVISVTGGIQAKSLTLDQAVVNANDSSITAAEALSIENSSVQSAALLGYADDAAGEKTIGLNNVTLSNVSAFGVSSAGIAVVSYDASAITSNTNSILYQDYSLTYSYGENTLSTSELGSEYANSYRVKTEGTANSIAGYHKADGTYIEAASVPLPVYTVDGYHYSGWYIDGASLPSTELSDGTGNRSLSASLEEGTYTVTLDLDYIVTEDTNDDSMPTGMTLNADNKTQTYNQNINTTILLPDPKRFGYTFTGWKAETSGNTFDAGSNYTVNAADSDSNSQILLKAQWKAIEDQFTIKFDLGTAVPVSNIKVSEQTIEEYVSANEHLTLNGTVITSDTKIAYGETLSSYLSRIGMSELPTLTDSRSGSSKEAFTDWATSIKNISVNGDMTYTLGSLIDGRTTQTLAEYQTNIISNSVIIKARWGTQSYKLTNLPDNDNWTYAYRTGTGESAQTHPVTVETSGQMRYITVPQGSTVILSCKKDSGESISYWSFTPEDGSKLQVRQEEYSNGPTYDYTFTMPACDVEASYFSTSDSAHPVYVNIAESPITFTENVSFHGRTGLSGFWYRKNMTKDTYDSDGDGTADMIVNAMAPLFYTTDISNSSAYADVTGEEVEGSGYYFYEFDSVNGNFYVTSKNEETKNQLKIINTAKVYLKDCDLTCRDAYQQDCVGTEIGTVEMMINSSAIRPAPLALDLSAYGNILIDLQQHNLYNVTIGIQGNNKIGAISTNKFYNTSSYMGTITVDGTDVAESELTLGTLFGSTNLNVQNMTLKENSDSHFDMLVCWPGAYNKGNVYFKNLKLQAPHRWVYSPSQNTVFSACKESEIGSVFCVWGGAQASSDLHVLGDWISLIHTLSLGDSKMVVDGSVIYGPTGNGSSNIRNSTLVVKGTVCDLHGTKIEGNSTVIANILNAGAGFTFNDSSKVITNMVTSKVHGDVSWDSVGKRWNLLPVSISDAAAMNEDGNGEPFLTHTSTRYGNTASCNVHSFQGSSQTYLFGYYKTINESYGNLYDLTIRADDQENPIAEVITEWENNNGTIDYVSLKSRITNAANKSVECVSFGYTKIPTTVSYQKVVQISENAEIYAAGNLTFFNHTTVRGGTVVCGGTFSTKRDLTVTGGSITATEIGNLYNLTMDADSTGTVKRWQKASFENCTLQTDRIGALSKVIEETEAKSTVWFGENVNVQARTAADVTVVSDIYVNYLYDSAQFTMDSIASDQKPGTLQFTKTFTPSSEPLATLAGLQQSALQTFGSPQVVGSTETGSWRFNSPAGYQINTVGVTGYVNGDIAKDVVYNAEQISLYAVKEYYTLQVKEGSSFVSSISASGSTQISEEQYRMQAGATVTLSLTDSAMVEKTVIWYRDTVGVFHNVENIQRTGKQVTFTMPTNDAEVFVANELKVYLDLSEISFTEDGFALEAPAENRRADSVFQYAGDFLVTETVEFTETYNCLYFETAAAGNVQDDGTLERNVTLKGINQLSSGIENGTDIADGAKVQLRLDGRNYLTRILNPEHSEVTLIGKTGPAQDIVSFRTISSSANNYACIYSPGKLGKSTLKNLTFDEKATTYLALFSSAVQSSVTVTLERVHGPASWTLEHYDRISWRVDHVIIKDSELCLRMDNIYAFQSCTDLTIENSSLKCIIGTSSADSTAPNLFYGISGVSRIVDSTVDFELRRSDARYFEGVAATFGDVILSGNSTFTADHRLMLKKLAVQDNAIVTIGSATAEGYLFCPDVTITDSAVLNTDYLFVSGFNSGTYQDNNLLMSAMAAGNSIVDGTSCGGLVLDGGMLNASQFVGGDVFGKITVNAGSLNTLRLGTLGKLCGYSKIIPPQGDEVFALFYEKIPTHATITITGGTVNVAANGYLGGMNADVNITGGTVNLANGAVLGMTDEQKDTLATSYKQNGDNIANHANTNIKVSIGNGAAVESDYSDPSAAATGNINTPYGNLSIEGSETKVKVAGIHAVGGTVTIKDTNSAYANPYSMPGEQNKKDTVGVLLTNGTAAETEENVLEAQTIYVEKEARIYAPRVLAKVSEGTGGIIVSDPTTNGNGGTGIYCGSYLVTGTGGNRDYDPTSNSVTQNLFKQQAEISIVYELNPDCSGNEMEAADEGRIKNNPANVDSFVYNQMNDSGEPQVALMDASCTGYYFEGWYTSEDYTQKYNGYISTNNAVTEQLVLYAKWSKIQVKFALVIDGTSTVESLDAEFTGLEGRWSEGTYAESDTYHRSTSIATVKYGDPIFSAAGVNLANYPTNTLVTIGVEFGDTDKYSGYSGADLRDDNNRVSIELAEYYREKSAENPDYVIVLHVNNMTKRYAQVTFDLNRGSMSSIPAFKNGISTSQTAVDTLEVDKPLSGSKFKGVTTEADKSHAHSKGLTIPQATGYTFYGWNTNKDAAFDAAVGWVNGDEIFSSNVTVYAIWRANTYMVRFQVEDPVNQDPTVRSFITEGNTMPAEAASESVSKDYYWVYDTPINESGTGFFLKNAETEQPMTAVPTGWREGYTFDRETGWEYHYRENDVDKTGYVTDGYTLNTSVVKALNTAFGDPDRNPTEPALILTAHFNKIKVTYHLEGGTMSGQTGQTVTLDNCAYGDALCGYTADATVIENQQEVFGNYSYMDHEGAEKNYGVISTLASYYKTSKQYVENDYRTALSRKGYTFLGWNTKADGTGKIIGSLPRFEDVDLYAQWDANTYTLSLRNKDNAYMYQSTDFTIASDAPASGTTASVTVGQPISAASGWPNRSGDWYAYSSGQNGEENKRRFLLGFTFASLDPGNSERTAGDEYSNVYVKYAEAVTGLINGGTLFQNGDTSHGISGTTFFLPEDTVYQNQIRSSYECRNTEESSGNRYANSFTVPDYPSGSTITMYAVYRERSLVYVETYKDPDGNTVSNVKYSCALTNYYDYPAAYNAKEADGSYKVESRQAIEDQGYSLIGWYVNGTSTKFAANETEYYTNLDSYKTVAQNNGTYDVMVYTVFAAQKTQTGMTLTASGDPKDVSWPTSTVFTIPASMQSGKLSMQVVTDTISSGLKIVSDTVMENHKYDSSWETYSADNTVAIKVTATSPDGNTTISKCVDESGMVNFGTSEGQWQVVNAGWKIRLELIHSKVMTESALKNMTFDLKFCFTSEGVDSYNASTNLLKDQWILFDNVKVDLTPSRYMVNYMLNLPEQCKELSVTDWKEFSEPMQDTSRQVIKSMKVSYGDDLEAAPEITGYTSPVDGSKTKWTWSDANTYTSLNMDTSAANGVINVECSYTAKTYTLKVDNDSNLSDWVITYSDGAESSVATTIATGGTAQVKYHSVIKVTPASGKSPTAEFVTLTMKSQGEGSSVTDKLAEYTGYGSSHNTETNTHCLAMLDKEETVIGWNDIQTLYLDDGTIELGETSYRQNGVSHIWTGKYVIWQNAANDASVGRTDGHPENTLKISGDLSAREIRVGNLQISADDSISLAEDAKANLSLNYTDTNDDKQPSAISAKNIFVPASDASKQTVLTIQTGLSSSGTAEKAAVTLSPSETNAAIGGSVSSVGSGNITVKDLVLNLTMPADSTSSGIGSGSSVGGTAHHTVNVSGCEVIVKEESSGLGHYKGAWIGGKTVSAVTIADGSVIRPYDNTTAMSDPVITDGSTVTINGSMIGTTEYSVKSPVYAETALHIKNSSITQHITTDLTSAQVKVPIGTASGNYIEVENSTIKSILQQRAYVSDLYSGSMLIKDKDSDVNIGGSQIVEVSHGNLAITDSGYTQDSKTHTNNGSSYLLLEELPKPASAPALTVNALGNNATITVRQPSNKCNGSGEAASANSEITFGKVSVNTDVTFVLNGNVATIDGDSNKLTIADGKTLTVMADDSSAYELKLGAGFDQTTRGSYVQTNGKLSGSSLVVGGDMTLNNVTAAANSGNLGSCDAGTTTAEKVTTVTINGGSVSADHIGAIGETQKTFTFLKLENNPVWTGTLVQDHYRIAYDNSGNNNLDTSDLNTILRTKTTKTGETETVTVVNPIDGIPANPSETATNLFWCWYINENEGVRKALMGESGSLPSGLSGRTSLGASTLDNVITDDVTDTMLPDATTDGTKTLTVHAWLKATGTTAIKEGRLVTTFAELDIETSVNGIQTNGAWTAQLICKGGNSMAGRDYKVIFSETLPEGTELTIANPVTKDGKTTTTYYRYQVSASDATGNKKEFKFSEFGKMGTEGCMNLAADTDVESETFLLSVDYAQAATAPAGGTVNFALLPDATSVIPLGTQLSYSMSPVTKGSISATGSNVTITTVPYGDNHLDGQKLFLAVKLSDATAAEPTVEVPFGTEAMLEQGGSSVTGTWVSRDTVLFEIGDYTSASSISTAKRTVAFNGLNEGNYKLTWTIVYGTGPKDNILGNKISNEAEGSLTVTNPAIGGMTAPWLSVEMTKQTHVISAGEGKTIDFTYKTTESRVTAKVQKQGLLCDFSDDTGSNITTLVSPVSNQAGTASVTFGSSATAGTYRICFSINDDSTEDDVYFVFIVE